MCSHVLSLAAYSCAHAKTADKGFFRSRMHPVVAQLTCVTAGAEVLRCLNLPDHLFHWVLGQFARGQQHHVYVHVQSRQLRWCGVRVTQFEPRGGPTPIEPNENPKYGNGFYHNMWSFICSSTCQYIMNGTAIREWYVKFYTRRVLRRVFHSAVICKIIISIT